MNGSASDSSEERGLNVDRRDVLKWAGAATVGVGMLSGTASAAESQFYECSRVCTCTDETLAVVETDDGYECRRLDKDDSDRAADRVDAAFACDTYACYEASDDETIVGVLHKTDDGEGSGDDEDEDDGGEDESKELTCRLCLNPNDCASDYSDSGDEILDDLDESTCGGCAEYTTTCRGEVFDSDGDESGPGEGDGDEN